MYIISLTTKIISTTYKTPYVYYVTCYTLHKCNLCLSTVRNVHADRDPYFVCCVQLNATPIIYRKGIPGGCHVTSTYLYTPFLRCYGLYVYTAQQRKTELHARHVITDVHICTHSCVSTLLACMHICDTPFRKDTYHTDTYYEQNNVT